MAMPPRVINLVPSGRRPVLVWSDASYEADDPRPAAGGFLLIRPRPDGLPPVVKWASEYTPEEVIARWGKRKQYIGVLEQYYGAAVYTSCPEDVEDADVLHFVDNTGAVAGFVKGYASAYDAGVIVNATQATQVRLRTTTYYEYVRSKANVADLPSRPEQGLAQLEVILRALGLWHLAERVEMRTPPIESWGEAAASWLVRAPQTAPPPPGAATVGSSLPTDLIEVLEPLVRRTIGLVRDVSDASQGSVYVGDDPAAGETTWAQPRRPRKASGREARLAAAQEALDWYTIWLLQPRETSGDRALGRARRELRGRRLRCHLSQPRQPVHASILAALANASDEELTLLRGRTPALR